MLHIGTIMLTTRRIGANLTAILVVITYLNLLKRIEDFSQI